MSKAKRPLLGAVRREMTYALVGGRASLYRKVGSSARRCLMVMGSWRRLARAIPRQMDLYQLCSLVETDHGSRRLYAGSGKVGPGLPPELPQTSSMFILKAEADKAERFSVASLGEADLPAIFRGGQLHVRLCFLDPSSGVVLCLVDGPFKTDRLPFGPQHDGEFSYGGTRSRRGHCCMQDRALTSR